MKNKRICKTLSALCLTMVVAFGFTDVYKRQAYWRTAFLFAQKTYRKQCSGYVYDAGYAALLYAGYVRTVSYTHLSITIKPQA